MTEKRYYAHKHLFQENQVHDKICHNFMSLDEIVEHMNNQYWKYKQLKEENEQLKQQMYYDGNDVLNKLATKCSKLEKENEQLKSEIAKLSYANEDLLTEKRNWFVLSNKYGE